MIIQNQQDKLFLERAKELVSKMTLQEKLMLLTTHHNAIDRLGIPEFYIGTEVARGYVGRSPEKLSTVFPQPVGLAGTFDKELMFELGEIAANEARAYYNESKNGGLCLWGPTVDMVRDPRWGRTEEAYGEDVCLAGELTAAYTKGMAGDNGKYLKTIPTLKHFCANNNEANRGNCNAYLPLRLKYEYYYAAFENAIRYGGAKSIMAAYNEINGVPGICNPDIQNILKDIWGLWFVVSDGGDFSQTVVSHKYCETHSQSLAMSIKAGADTMTDNEELVRNAALSALKNGELTEADIDLTLYNVMFARFKLGQFDSDCPYNEIDKTIIDCKEYSEVNLRATREQVVLLKNNGILPLKTEPKKIAVVGALADESLMDWYTGYASKNNSVLTGIKDEFKESEVSYDSLWDVVSVKAPNGKYFSVKETGEVIADAEEVTESEMFELQQWGENWNNFFSVKYKKYVRLFEDLALKLNKRVVYDWFTRETFNFKEHFGKLIIEEFLNHRRVICDNNGVLTVTTDKAVTDSCLFEIKVLSCGQDRAEKLAKENDFVLYCIGNHPVQVAKECYDRKTLSLNIQQGMAKKLFAVNHNTVMTVISSYPYAICEENECLPAILYTSHAGMYLGTAVAEVLNGKYNPAGRLALTWYRSENDLPDIMEYDIENGKTTYMYFEGKPLYPFGYGLSYSSFKYDNFTLENAEDCLLARLTVTNTGEYDGDEVVQIYFTLKGSQVKRAKKKLCGFERVFIKAGETVDVTVRIPHHILKIYDVRTAKMLLEQGEYSFMAAASSDDIRLCGNVFVEGEQKQPRGDSFTADSYESCKNVRIFYSKNLLRNYIRVTSYSGSATYEGVVLAGKTKLVVSAQSTVKPSSLRADFGNGVTSQVAVTPANAFDDFAEYQLDIPSEAQDSNVLTLSTDENCSILDIKIQ
ncbi:MAG: glycoside hydrolase family 3 C-terminal domain-containing protein [Oscillospiraceae bacterium]|nr:glycoside hydrolase family 3 C-terminal domain-containing protein [Oscillospiraceae bacterium]